MEKQTSVCILVPVFNRKHYTIPFIESIQKQSFRDYKLIIIDDGSTDGTSAEIKEKYPDVDIIFGDGNWWWTKSIVEGITYSKDKYGPRYYLLLNDDLEVKADYINSFIKKANAHNEIQCSLGVNIENHAETIIPGHIFNQYTGLFRLPKNMDETQVPNFCLPGRGLFFSAEILKKTMFDSKQFPQTCGDYDFTYSAKINGGKAIINTEAKVYYYVNETSTKKYFNQYSYLMLKYYITEIKSSCAFKTIYNFNKKHVQHGFITVSILLGVSKCILGYVFRWINIK